MQCVPFLVSHLPLVHSKDQKVKLIIGENEGVFFYRARCLVLCCASVSNKNHKKITLSPICVLEKIISNCVHPTHSIDCVRSSVFERIAITVDDHKGLVLDTERNMDFENHDVCEKIINDIDAVFNRDPNL